MTPLEKRKLVRVFVKGGILAPVDLKKIASVANWFESESIHFGSRQDILFAAEHATPSQVEEAFKSTSIEYSQDEQANNNIVSSFVSTGMLPSTHWVHTDTYHFVLDTFKNAKYKVNVVDPAQTLVPLFSGNINIIASEYDNYWFIVLSFSAEKRRFLNQLVYTYDLAKATAIIERMKEQGADSVQKIEDEFQLAALNIRPADLELTLPETNFTDYEGFHQYNNKWWLGLYWRNNCYDTHFLQAMCDLCKETKVGKIALTPWKSFIVKDIKANDKMKWEKLLGKYGINPRHSSLELNWHVPLLDLEAMQLKRYLIRIFDQNDILTSGLSFSIKTGDFNTFTSIVIEKDQASKFQGNFELEPTYTITHTKNFDPLSNEYVVYASHVLKEDLPPLLMQLSKTYFEGLDDLPDLSRRPSFEKKQQTIGAHQCPDCLSIYDERVGEPTNAIVPGVAFEALLDTYTCSLCASPKHAFVPIEIPA